MIDWLIWSCAVSGAPSPATHLAEERVETVHLRLLLEERVVLGDATQRQIVHEVDLVGLDHVLVLHNQLCVDARGGP